MSEEKYIRIIIARSFEPYRSSDRVIITPGADFTRVEYGPNNHSLNFTRFHIRVDPDEAHVYAFSIHPDHRGRGFGRQLYSAVEEIADYYYSSSITLEPIGDGHDFWPRMGFRELNEDMLVKEVLSAGCLP